VTSTLTERTAATVGPRPRSVKLRLVLLHLMSRQLHWVALILAGCATVLGVALNGGWIEGSGPLAQQVPVILEAAAAAVIAVSTRSPFGEGELANGRLLPRLRTGAVLALAALAVGLFSAGAAAGSLPDGAIALTRNTLGMVGLGLISATLLGGSLSWVGPVAYAAVTEFVLTAAWRTPWIWPARPPHDTGAALCAALVLVVGVVLLAVRGPRDSSKE
jgi:hypothetical protein